MADRELRNNSDFEQVVRETAYFLWQQAGSPEGRDQEFWYRSLQRHARGPTADELNALGKHDFLNTWDE